MDVYGRYNYSEWGFLIQLIIGGTAACIIHQPIEHQMFRKHRQPQKPVHSWSSHPKTRPVAIKGWRQWPALGGHASRFPNDQSAVVERFLSSRQKLHFPKMEQGTIHHPEN